MSAEPSLALPWLESHCAEAAEVDGIAPSEVVEVALGRLSNEERCELLPLVPEDSRGKQLLRWLIGESVVLYRRQLAAARLRPLRLEPLQGRVPDDRQWRMADLANDDGHDAEVIAQSAFRFGEATP